jgi:hypothetical protein
MHKASLTALANAAVSELRALLAKALIGFYCLTWNHTGYKAEKPVPKEPMATTPAEANNLLTAFRGSYGRLCHLTCKALRDGAPQSEVLEAFQGEGAYGAPALNRIRTAWVETNEALRRARTTHTMDECVAVAQGVREAHEGEWMVEIPAGVAA